MTEETRPTEPTGVPGDGRAPAAPKLTRRRFTKAGVAAPLIMTLASRPVWGQCVTPSGQLSQLTTGDASNHLAEGKFDCVGTEGMSASWWRENPDQWIGRYYEQENGNWHNCASTTTPPEQVDVYRSRNDTTFEICGYIILDPYEALIGDDLNAQLVAAKLNMEADLDFGYDETTLGPICTDWEADENDILVIFLAELNNRGGLTGSYRSDITSVCKGSDTEHVLTASGSVGSAVAKI